MVKRLMNRFEYLTDNAGSTIIVDLETGVEYLKNGKDPIMLVDADGKPKINKDWYDSH
ncbi:DUF6440 family protein [Streptococcus jiangjianxini]|uniref:DUF6440 family protein n=1 Tax=Streptococcus jiangjianxini TaxID=3161189 RepID=UPI0032EBAD27